MAKGDFVKNITIRSGTSFARSPVVDGHLQQDEVEKVYDRWEEDWPFETYSGGVKGITCSHVIEVGFQSLAKIFGVRFAKRLITIAEANNV
jgi:hypothetical protein